MDGKALQDTIQEPRITRDNLLMALKSPSGLSKVWVLLEGEADVTVYGRFFSEQTVSVKQACSDTGHGGHKIVEEIVRYVTTSVPAAAVFGIRDKDYTSYYVPSYHLPNNVFVTDRKDLEMMLAEAPSVRSQLSVSLPGFSEVEKSIMPVLRHLGYSRAYLGCHGILCEFEKYFKPSMIWDFSAHCFNTDWEAFCMSSFQAATGVLSTELDRFVAERRLEAESDFDICRGHDYVGYLSKAMIKTDQYSEAYIGGILYTTYTKADFEKTKLYASIKAWQGFRGVVVV